jgi:hypothetical protein
MMRSEKSILALVPAAMLAGVTPAVPDACDAHSVHACAPAPSHPADERPGQWSVEQLVSPAVSNAGAAQVAHLQGTAISSSLVSATLTTG